MQFSKIEELTMNEIEQVNGGGFPAFIAYWGVRALIVGALAYSAEAH